MKSSAKKTKAFSTLIGKYVHEPAQWFAKNYAKNIIERQRLSVLLLTTVGVLLIVPLNILGIPGESDPVFVKLDIAWLITIPVTMTAMLKRKISLSANLKSQLLIALTIFSAAMIYSAFHTNEDYYQVMIFRYNTLSVSMLMLSHKPLQAHHISHELRNPCHVPCLLVHIQRRIHQEPAAAVFHCIYIDFHTRRKTSRRHKRAANRERRTAKRRGKPHKAPRARQTTGKRTAETGTNKKSRRKADNKNARHDGRPKQRKTLYRRERIHNPKEHSALRHKQGIPRTQCLGSRNMPTHTARQKIIGDMRHAQQKSGQHNKPAYSHTRQT